MGGDRAAIKWYWIIIKNLYRIQSRCSQLFADIDRVFQTMSEKLSFRKEGENKPSTFVMNDKIL